MGIVKALRFPVGAHWIGGRLLRLGAGRKPSLVVATPPEFKHGVIGLWSPEELLVGAVATCYELTLVAMAERRDVPLYALEARATGHVEHEATHGYGFTVIELDVELETDAGREPAAAEVARLAEKHCIVAGALEVPVHLRVETRTRPLEAVGA